jgi:hypothetical protein
MIHVPPNMALEPTAAPLIHSTVAVVRTRVVLHRPRLRPWLSLSSLGHESRRFRTHESAAHQCPFYP